MNAIEQRRSQLLVMAEWLRRDLERRALGSEAEQRVCWYLIRAVEAMDCAIAEAANGALANERLPSAKSQRAGE